MSSGTEAETWALFTGWPSLEELNQSSYNSLVSSLEKQSVRNRIVFCHIPPPSSLSPQISMLKRTLDVTVFADGAFEEVIKVK